jgi:hypothetical protein
MRLAVNDHPNCGLLLFQLNRFHLFFRLHSSSDSYDLGASDNARDPI